jgi:hypothetical protein
VQFPHDADIDPETRVKTTLARLPFIIPATCSGSRGARFPRA